MFSGTFPGFVEIDPMKSPAFLILMLAMTTLLCSNSSEAYQPVLREKVSVSWGRVMGPLTGNPVVNLRGDLVEGEVVRSRFNDVPKWIVSEDLDSDGIDKAVIMFDDGTLRSLALERGSLRAGSSVKDFNPEVPPIILTTDTKAADRGIIGIDDRGELVYVKPGGQSSSRISDDGFSRVTYPVAADLDGDGKEELLAISDEGLFSVILGRNSRERERAVDILPDSRITVGDLNADGVLEAVALTRPSDGFSPERLGDGIEALGVAVFSFNGRFLDMEDEFELDTGEFFEVLTPLIADVRDGGGSEIVLTVSGEGRGSELIVLSYSGDRLREVRRSSVGREGRYVQALGAAVIGDSDRKLILAVSDPSGGGDLLGFRTDLAATRLSLDSSISTHLKGTRTLENALIGDFNGDGKREILAPNEDRKSLSLFVLERNRFTDREIFIGNRTVSSNLCPGDFNGDGKVDVAAGFEDGTVIFILGK